MRKMLVRILFILFCYGAFEAFAYGLAPLEEHESLHLETRVHKVIDVKLNAIGAERMQQDDSCAPHEEFTKVQMSTAEAALMISSEATLPVSVDNTQLPSFPPIGNQGQLGSCVAWGSTYYQASHELGLLNGIDNKKNYNQVLSPKWTYDILDDGMNNGLSVLDAYALLYINGAPSILKFPYDSNYTSWDLNGDDWVSAINNRMAPYALIPGLGGSGPQNLNAIKTALVNGHVLTFATFIDSWVFTKIKHDPQNLDNNHVGEYAAVYMNGYSGGHFMTVVGYNDNLWIDVNGNGSVDSGERGAFLIANSWSNSWGNKGLIWISYDAFLAASAVPSGPNKNRVAAGIYLNNNFITATPKAKNYTPKLVAQFSLSQTVRNQISIEAGASPLSYMMPITTLSDYALMNQGGALAFNGASSKRAQTATFALDLTDLLADDMMAQRFYLTVSDNAPGNPTVLNSYSLLDLEHQTKISYPTLPATYDNSSGTIYLDYDFTSAMQP